MAPDDARGFGPAHRIRVGQLVSQSLLNLPALEHHLRRTVDFDADDTQAHRILAELLYRQRRFEEAAEHFEKVSDTAPDVLFTLFRLYADHLKLPEQAQASLVRAVSHYSDRIDSDHSDADSQLLLAEAHQLAGRYHTAIEFLENSLGSGNDARIREGLWQIHMREFDSIISAGVEQLSQLDFRRLSQALAGALKQDAGRVREVMRSAALVRARARDEMLPFDDLDRVLNDATRAVESRLGGEQDAEMRQALVRRYTLEFDTIVAGGLERSSTAKLRRLPELLDGALQFSPDPPVDVISRAASMRAEGRNELLSERVWSTLDKALDNGTVPAEACLVLGTSLAQRGQLDHARDLLERAYELKQDDSRIANNLSWVLMHLDPPRTDRALDLAAIAVRAAPDEPSHRETLGQLLIDCGQWRRAVAELETALQLGRRRSDWPSSQTKAAMHRSLAIAYDNLGDPQLASLHREASQKALQDTD